MQATLDRPALLPAVAQQDAGAMRALVDRYAGLVWSLVRRKVRNQGDAEDLVQEIFADIWKSASRFDARAGSEDTFVAVIARRRVIDYIRKAARAATPVSIDGQAEPGVEAVDPLESMSDEAQAALKVLATLRPERRRAIELSIVHGLSHSRIAEVTGMPLGTVKAHVRRGLEEIRRALETQLPAESLKEVSP